VTHKLNALMFWVDMCCPGPLGGLGLSHVIALTLSAPRTPQQD
jgi:hypothetical protein